MAAVTELATSTDTRTACLAVGLPRATYYRLKAGVAAGRRTVRRGRAPAWQLSAEERAQVLEVLHAPRFVDKAPAEVYATLLDEDVYLCSERTMYRILAAEGEVRERRDQLRHPVAAKPELVAQAPNQVWSWDITQVKTVEKWAFYALYVVLDIFSRFVVGWSLVLRENAAVARQLIEACCREQGITRQQLTLHADRGSAMTSKTLAELLIDLGVARSHSRPHVSNDNAFSEAQFKTVKYRPDSPECFGPIQDARAYFAQLFRWYNHEHRHAGIGLLTPADVHYGRAQEVIARRQSVLMAAYAAHPERFRRPPTAPSIPSEVWINHPGTGSLPVGQPTTK